MIMGVNAKPFNGSLSECLSPHTRFRKALNNNRQLMCFTETTWEAPCAAPGMLDDLCIYFMTVWFH